MKILEYGKNNEGYWDGIKLVKQIKEKALPIAEAFYPGYLFLFSFDNATSYLVYLIDALWVKNMSKESGSKQAFLKDGWYFQDKLQITQKMYIENPDRTWCHKGIQKVLKKKEFLAY